MEPNRSQNLFKKNSSRVGDTLLSELLKILRACECSELNSVQINAAKKNCSSGDSMRRIDMAIAQVS